MPAAEIREAGAGEGRALLVAYEWLFAPARRATAGLGAERAEARLEEAIAADDSTVFVAEDDGELVGLCSAYLELNSVRYGQRCWVEDLAVHPDSRSRGIGGALLDAA